MWLSISVLLLWIAPWIAVSLHAILQKSEPRSALLWIFSSLSLPVLGPLLYLFIGVNRIHRRAVRRLGTRELPFELSGELPVDRASPPPGSPGTPLADLREVGDRIETLPILPGNHVDLLEGGEQAYPAMLGAILEARHSITLTSYIFDTDAIGRRFADALSAAAKRGVRVHVLLDGVGAMGSVRRITRHLTRSGVEVAAFFPLSFPFGRFRVNFRNHRKILVVDGREGFTGGMNISRRHLIRRLREGTSDDLHLRVRGPIVGELQHVNDEDWTLATEESFPNDDRYYPAPEAAGGAWCRAIAGGPDQDERRFSRMVQAACASAAKSVRIVTPYFLPPEAILSHLVMTRLRGVDVRLLLPKRTDIPMVRWASDSFLPILLRYGVDVRHAPPPFLHAKAMLVDDCWSLIGSSNLDPRSLRLNFEFDVEIWDTEFHARMINWFDRRWNAAHPMTAEHLASRPLLQRYRTGFARLAAPLL